MCDDRTKDDLAPEELERQQGEPLPERAAMTLVNPAQHLILPPLPVSDPGEVTIDPVPNT